MPFYFVLFYLAYVYNRVLPCPDLQYFQNFYTDLKNRNRDNNNNKNKNTNTNVLNDKIIDEIDDIDDDDMYDDINDNNLNDNGQQIFDPASSGILGSSNMNDNPSGPQRVMDIEYNKNTKSGQVRYHYENTNVVQNYGHQKKQFCYINDDIHIYDIFILISFVLFSFLLFYFNLLYFTMKCK